MGSFKNFKKRLIEEEEMGIFQDEQIEEEDMQTKEGKTITLERIKNIAKDIIDDTEWVNDSHTKAEHNGIKDGLERLIRHLEEVDLWNCRVCNATGKLVEDLSPVGENRPEPFYYFCPSCNGKGVVIIPKSNTIAYLKAILREDDKFLDNQDFSIIIEKYKQKKGQ